MDKITLEIKNHLGLEMSNSLLGCHYTSGHQALKSKEEIIKHKRNNFFIKEEINIKKYKSITIVDDVITTGSTLEMISRVLKAHYGEQLEVNGLCLFRGKPNFKIQ
jgi:predicted amidophosphoribosyltransferase